MTAEVGLDRVVLPMGSNFGDLDNDGFLDIYLGTGRPSYSYLMPNVLLRNDGGRRFEDVTAATGTGHLQKGHGVAFADWDRDGDADIFLEAGGAAPGDRAHNVLFQNPGLRPPLADGQARRRPDQPRRARCPDPGRPAGRRRRGRLPLPDDHGRVELRRQSPGLHRRPGPGRDDPRARGLLADQRDPPDVRIDVPIDRAVEITEGRPGSGILDAPPIPLP